MGLHEWTISDKDSSGNLEERGKGEYKRLRASLQFTTSTEVKNMADMSDRGWDAARITDLYLTRRPARVRIENLHRGWMTAGGEVESLDRFLARLIADGQKLAADRKPPTLITDTDDLASSGIRMAGEVASEIIGDLAGKAKVITEVETESDSNRQVEDSDMVDTEPIMSDNYSSGTRITSVMTDKKN